jgi:hypothetical protein
MLRASAVALLLCLVAAGCGGSQHPKAVSDSQAILVAWHARNYYFNHFLIVPGTVGCNVTEIGAFPVVIPGKCTTAVTDESGGGRRISFLEHWKTASAAVPSTGGWVVTEDARGKVRRIAITGSRPPELWSTP